MKGGQCPACSHPIGVMQYAQHSFWTPIVCESCGRKYTFDSRSWYRLLTPVIVSILLNWLIILVGRDLLSQQGYLYISVACMSLMFVVMWNFVSSIPRVKLVERS